MLIAKEAESTQRAAANEHSPHSHSPGLWYGMVWYGMVWLNVCTIILNTRKNYQDTIIQRKMKINEH